MILKQLLLLMWKNIATRRRKPAVLLLSEVSVFLLSAILVFGLRYAFPQKKIDLYQEGILKQGSEKGQQVRQVTKLIVAYAPIRIATKSFVEELMQRFLKDGEAYNVLFVGFFSETRLLDFIANNGSALDVALILRNFTLSSMGVKTQHFSANGAGAGTSCPQNQSIDNLRTMGVTIRPVTTLDSLNYWNTDTMFPREPVYCQTNNLKGYTTKGINRLLQFTMEVLTRIHTLNQPRITLSTGKIYCDQLLIDPFLRPLQFLLPTTVFVAFLPFALFTAIDMAIEKNRMIQATLATVGVHGGVYIISWILFAALQVFLVAALMTVLFCFPVKVTIIWQSEPSLVFALFALYGLAVTFVSLWAMELQIKGVTTAALIFALVTVLQVVPTTYCAFCSEFLSLAESLLCCLFIICALYIGCYLIIKHEETGEGADWSSFWTPPTILHKVSLFQCMLMMAVDICLYAALWLLFRNTRSICNALHSLKPKVVSSGHYRPTYIAEGEHGLRNLLRFVRVTKLCGNNDKCWTPLHDVSFNVYKNRTTVLLGHEKSGKSEIIRVLAGQSTPNLGSVLLNNILLADYLSHYPCSIGVCPQYNSFFDALTVVENVQLFGELRGSHPEGSLKTIRLCELSDYRNKTAKSLSAASARLLSLCMACVGEPEVLLIDDPVIDLELNQTREVLTILKTVLSSRSSVITTASKEVAYQLADKIAILTEGHVPCFGSKTFIEYQFGVGYRLHLNAHPGCDVDTLTCYAQFFVSDMIVLKKSFRELVYLLPRNSTVKFEFLFSNLQVRDTELRIRDLRIKDITFKEIFYKLRNYKTVVAHLREVGKLRAATDLISLSLTSDDVETPRILYSALVKTDSNRFVVASSQALDLMTSVMNTATDVPTFNLRTLGAAYMRGFPQFGFFLPRAQNAIKGTSNEQTGDGMTLNINMSMRSSDSSPVNIVMPYEIENADCVLIRKRGNNRGKMFGNGEFLINGCSNPYDNIINNAAVKFPRGLACTSRVRRTVRSSVRVKSCRCDVAQTGESAPVPSLKELASAVLARTLSPDFGGNRPLLSHNHNDNARHNVKQERKSSRANSKLKSQVSCMDTDPDIYELSPKMDSSTAEQELYLQNCVGSAFQHGISLVICRLRILVIKRILYTVRYRFLTFVQLFLPLGLMWTIFLAWRNESPTLLFDFVSVEKLLLDTRSVAGTNVLLQYDNRKKEIIQLASAYKKLMGPSVKFEAFSDVPLSTNLLTRRKGAYLIGAAFTTDIFNLSTNLLRITAFYNTQAYHSESLSIVLAMKAVYTHLVCKYHGTSLGNTTRLSNWTDIQVAIHPLPVRRQEANRHVCFTLHSLCARLSIIILLSLAFMTSMCSIIDIQERAIGSTHLQKLSGATSFTRFCSSYCFDCLLCAMECACIVLTLTLFQNTKYAFGHNPHLSMLMLLWHAAAFLPMVYTFQLLFTSAFQCVVSVCIVRAVIGTTLLLLKANEELRFFTVLPLLPDRNVWTILQTVFPSYSLVTNLYSACLFFQKRKSGLTNVCNADQFNLDTLPIFVMTLIQLLVWVSLWALLEAEVLQLMCFQRRKFTQQLWGKRASLYHAGRGRSSSLDVSPSQIKYGEGEDYIILENVVTVSQIQDQEHTTLDDLSASFREGDWVYVVGKNGCGKSELMKVLAGCTAVYTGKLTFNTHSGLSLASKRRARVSYCPQHDALMSDLTGYETLFLYARLRGLSSYLAHLTASSLLKIFGIKDIGDNICGNYRVSEQRKLSIAMALIGDPLIIILDEPTLELDYVDAKCVWHFLSRLNLRKRTIFIASSWIEDFGEMCNQVAIMNEGVVEYAMPLSSLIRKYGLGYLVVAVFERDKHGKPFPHAPFFNNVAEAFPLVEITLEDYFAYLKFQNEDLNLAKLFALLEDGKRYYNIAEYSVRHPSLSHAVSSLLLRPEVERIEVSPGALSSFDHWPPSKSSEINDEVQLY